jgi:ornithine decarboxylase
LIVVLLGLAKLAIPTRSEEVIIPSEERIARVIEKYIQNNPGNEAPFAVLDVEKILERVEQWKRHFPRVIPHFAVKSNPDTVMVAVMAALDMRFDCASMVRLIKIE